MEMKWSMIAVAVIFCTIFVALGVKEYMGSQCRIEAVRAGMDADSVLKTCKSVK